MRNGSLPFRSTLPGLALRLDEDDSGKRTNVTASCRPLLSG